MSRCWRPASDLASAADTTSRPKHRLIIPPVSLTPRLPNLLLCSAVPKGNPKSGRPLGRRPHSRTNNVSARSTPTTKATVFIGGTLLTQPKDRYLSTTLPIYSPYRTGLDIYPCHSLTRSGASALRGGDRALRSRPRFHERRPQRIQRQDRLRALGDGLPCRARHRGERRFLSCADGCQAVAPYAYHGGGPAARQGARQDGIGPLGLSSQHWTGARSPAAEWRRAGRLFRQAWHNHPGGHGANSPFAKALAAYLEERELDPVPKGSRPRPGGNCGTSREPSCS